MDIEQNKSIGEIVVCPNCDIDLELDEAETKDKRFTCPLCDQSFDLEKDPSVRRANNRRRDITFMERWLRNPLARAGFFFLVSVAGWFITGVSFATQTFPSSINTFVFLSGIGMMLMGGWLVLINFILWIRE